MPDIFISYAHEDDNSPVSGSPGWVDRFNTMLRQRLDGIRGKAVSTSVFLDDSDEGIRGTSLLTETIKSAIRETSVLLVIISPSYLTSKWCERELQFFKDSAASSGGLSVSNKTRVVKVFKLPADLANSGLGDEAISDATGYEFFSVGGNGRPLEFAPQIGNDVGPDFWARLNTLAYDLRDLLNDIANRPIPSPRTNVTVYVAESTLDVADKRESMLRELRQSNYSVLPQNGIPRDFTYEDLVAVVTKELRNARLSIHLVGESYAMTPEGAPETIVETQYRLAGEEASKRKNFVRLPWISPGTNPDDQRQQAFIKSLQEDDSLVEGSIEQLKDRVCAELEKRPLDDDPSPFNAKKVYLIFDPPDHDRIKPFDDFLFAHGFNVLKPSTKGSPGELRKRHRWKLRISDGALIYYGWPNEDWLDTKLQDLEAIYARGRGPDRPLLARGVVLADPATPEKKEFRWRKVRVVPGFGEFRPDILQGFIDDLNQDNGGTP
jgi:hypothetical protein